MPWEVRDNCVYKQGEREPVPGGCHASHAEAVAHLQALYASEDAGRTKMALAPTLLDLIGKQITRERYAVAVYTALGNWADAQAFPGLTGWADAASAEEATHAQKFIDYLRDRGPVRLEAVDAPPVDFGTYADALAAALALEKEVSAAITAIYQRAVAERDGATADLAQWFLAEQVQSEKELEVLLRRVGRGAPIDLLDAELFEEAEA